MTLRTGRGSAGGTYRDYTCSTKARQDKTGCEGRTNQMDRLDPLVVDHIEARLLRPTRLETILSSVIDHRQKRTARHREHLAELHQRITEAEQRLGRLFDAIESGLVDSVARDRIAGLKAVRDQAQSGADRIKAALESEGGEAISTDMLKTVAPRGRMDTAGKRRLPSQPPSRPDAARRGG